MKKLFKDKGGKKFGSDSDRPLHDAVCAECGTDCQVPFRPSGSRPVLCRNCFKKDDGGEKRPFEKKFAGSGDSKVEQRLKFIEMKLDRILAAIENADANKLF